MRHNRLKQNVGQPPRRAPAGEGAAPQARAHFLDERAERWMFWAKGHRGPVSGDDVRELVESGALQRYKEDRREAAQEYAYEALETDDRERAHFLARQALVFDPACADARRVLADVAASSHIDRVGQLKKALLDEEERLGAVLTEFDGRLSEAVEALPYLRTRFDLACALWAAERRPRALGHLETLRAQDADDAVGARYPLLMARLHAGDHVGAKALLDDARTAEAELIVRWARVLERVLAGDVAGADAAYDALRAEYGSEAESLASPPPAEFAFPGYFRDDINEYAALCLRMLHWAWHAHDASAAWLRSHASA